MEQIIYLTYYKQYSFYSFNRLLKTYCKNFILFFSANEPAKECSVTDCVDSRRSIDNNNNNNENYNEETGSGSKCLNLNEVAGPAGTDAIGGSSSLSSGAKTFIVSFVGVAVLAVVVGIAS
jgi:hypothetical protein